MAKTSALNPIEELADEDLLVVVDVSDKTMAKTGTNKVLTWGQLKGFLGTGNAGAGKLDYYNGITGLTGGGETNLDGVVTVPLPVRTLVMLVINNVPQTWMLYAGTDAEDAGAGIVQPDDYDGETNAKVWKQIA